MKQLPAGAVAPDFELKTLDNRTMRLSTALSACPVVLAFFKASCPTCQFTFPYLQRIFTETVWQDGAVLWGISQDDAAETSGFIREFSLGFDILLDPHPYEISASYGLEYVPSIIIVGADGRIQTSDYGFSKPALIDVAEMLASSSGRPAAIFSEDDGIPARRPG